MMLNDDDDDDDDDDSALKVKIIHIDDGGV